MSIAADIFQERLDNLMEASMDSGVTNREVIGCLELTKMRVFEQMLIIESESDGEDVQSE